MPHCRYCNESDEGKLIISTRAVNGRVETIDICLRCFWIDKFKHEAEGDGKALRECERANKGIESVRDINPLSLQE